MALGPAARCMMRSVHAIDSNVVGLPGMTFAFAKAFPEYHKDNHTTERKRRPCDSCLRAVDVRAAPKWLLLDVQRLCVVLKMRCDC